MSMHLNELAIFFSKALTSDRSDEFLIKLIQTCDTDDLSNGHSEDTYLKHEPIIRTLLEHCKSEQVLEAFLDKFPQSVLINISPSSLELAIEQKHSSAIVLKIISIIAANERSKSVLGSAIPCAMRMERVDKEIL